MTQPITEDVKTRERVAQDIDILVIGTDHQWLNRIAGLFTENRFHVLTANTGRAGLTAMKLKPFDLVLTQLYMGPVDGFDVLKEAKTVNPGMIVIVIADETDEKTMRVALEAGVDDIIFGHASNAEIRLRVRLNIRRMREKTGLQAMIRHSKTLAEDIVGRTRVGMLIIDSDGTVAWHNQSAARMLGVDFPDLVNRNYRELVHSRLKFMFENPRRFAVDALAPLENKGLTKASACRTAVVAPYGPKTIFLFTRPIRSGQYAGGFLQEFISASSPE